MLVSHFATYVWNMLWEVGFFQVSSPALDHEDTRIHCGQNKDHENVEIQPSFFLISPKLKNPTFFLISSFPLVGPKRTDKGLKASLNS